MGWCKTDVTPLLTQWSYVFLAPTNQYVNIYLEKHSWSFKCPIYSNHTVNLWYQIIQWMFYYLPWWNVAPSHQPPCNNHISLTWKWKRTYNYRILIQYLNYTRLLKPIAAKNKPQKNPDFCCVHFCDVLCGVSVNSLRHFDAYICQ